MRKSIFACAIALALVATGVWLWILKTRASPRSNSASAVAAEVRSAEDNLTKKGVAEPHVVGGIVPSPNPSAAVDSYR